MNGLVKELGHVLFDDVHDPTVDQMGHMCGHAPVHIPEIPDELEVREHEGVSVRVTEATTHRGKELVRTRSVLTEELCEGGGERVLLLKQHKRRDFFENGRNRVGIGQSSRRQGKQS